MRNPVKIPKVTNDGKSYTTLKHFLLSLLATTISIVLTFGTSAFIEKREKEAAKREMVMMIICDFDKTIEQLQHADTVLHQASLMQQTLAIHPEYFDSLRIKFVPAIMVSQTDFTKTTEKIFSSSIETFNTLGNVNFVQEVSSFYNLRQDYQEGILDKLEKTIIGLDYLSSVKNLFTFDFPELYFENTFYMLAMQKTRNRCMKMMNISEEELKEFSQQQILSEEDSEDYDALQFQMAKEMMEAQDIIEQAREKFEQEEYLDK